LLIVASTVAAIAVTGAIFFFAVLRPSIERDIERGRAEAECSREWNNDLKIRKCGDFIARYTDKNASAYAERARAFGEKRDYENAFADVNRAIGLEPNAARFFSIRAALHNDRGDVASAVNDYSRAIALDPHSGFDFYFRAQLRLPNDAEAALADLNEAVKLNPGSVSFRLRRGALLDDLKRFDSAIGDWDALIAISPKVGDYYYFRGLSKAGAGRIEEAKADFRTALEVYPDFDRARAALKRLGN
jgi:tetratricopeptide (TPR) repeat protein